MNLGSLIHFSIFLIFSHFEWLVFGVSSGLLPMVWCLVGLGFDIKIHVKSDWQVVQAYSKSDFVNLSSVVPLWLWHLLPLTQNTLPSKDVREYVFWCYLMPWRSRDLLGMILNEFGINHSFQNFSHFSHFEWLVFGVSSGLLYVVWWLFGLGFDIKIKVESDWQVFQAYSISFFVICQKWSLYDRGAFCL